MSDVILKWQDKAVCSYFMNSFCSMKLAKQGDALLIASSRSTPTGLALITYSWVVATMLIALREKA